MVALLFLQRVEKKAVYHFNHVLMLGFCFCMVSGEFAKEGRGPHLDVYVSPYLLDIYVPLLRRDMDETKCMSVILSATSLFIASVRYLILTCTRSLECCLSLTIRCVWASSLLIHLGMMYR
ncbi:hypothetical protein VTL71DRAFT_1359 [Oculimacula yallundae]|uniref:Uncharacterized protein n=1 Tax=Oculimacula yallundae TaxID=86028 RepID=A0ABR4CAH8_9HELO